MRKIRSRRSHPKVFDSAKAHGVADAAQAQRRREEGWQMIAVASEAGFMLAKAGEIVQALGLGQRGPLARY